MFVFAIFFTYNLQFYVPATILYSAVRRRITNERYHDFGEYVFRTFLVLLTSKLFLVVYGGFEMGYHGTIGVTCKHKN